MNKGAPGYLLKKNGTLDLVNDCETLVVSPKILFLFLFWSCPTVAKSVIRAKVDVYVNAYA